MKQSKPLRRKQKVNLKNETMLNCAASIRIEGMAISMVKKMYGTDPTSIIGLPLIKVVEFLKYFVD